MPRSPRAFSLIELLAVLAILAVLAALLFPMFARAKASAKVETSKEYLRQQYVTLEIYAQDHEGALPNWEVVQNTNSMRAPCSPLDDWKTPCWSRPSPMLGSYGYVLPLKGKLTDPVARMEGGRPLLGDAFSADYRLGEFAGDGFKDYAACTLAGTCYYPERLWFVYTDGSLHDQRNPAPPKDFRAGVGRARELFSWQGAFGRQMDRDDARRSGGG